VNGRYMTNNDLQSIKQKTNDRPTLKNRIKETKRHCLKLPPCFSRPYIFPQTYILFKSRVFKAIYVSQFLLITTLIWPRTESKWGTTYSLFTIYITAVILYLLNKESHQLGLNNLKIYSTCLYCVKTNTR
jgi:hypothetical protein